jgi:hypothetical protein
MGFLKRRHVCAVITAAVMLAAVSSMAAVTWTATFTCTPLFIAAFPPQRIHVRCTAGAPPANSIYYFAFSTKKKEAPLVLEVLLAAKAQGKNLLIYYNPEDLSGQKIGCATNDCRLIYGAEIRE